MNLLLDLVDAGKYNEALAEIDSLEYPETLEGEFWRIHISWYKFHSTDSIKIAESAIKLADDNDQPVWKLLYYLSGSIALIILREYDQALTWIDNLEELIDQLENHSEYEERESEVQQMYLAVKAYIHLKGGLLDDSIDLYEKAVALGEKGESSWKGINTIRSIGYSTLGNVYLLKGKFDEAFEIFKKRLALAYEMKNLIFIWRSQQQISEVYWKTNQYFDAYHNLKIVLAKFYDLKDRNELVLRHKVQSLFKLVILALKMSKPSEADEYYQQLKEANSEITSGYPYALKLSRALILKSSNKLRDKVTALDILIEINSEIDKSKLFVSDGIVDDNIPLITLLNLYDLYLWELKSTENDEIISEIDELSSKLIFLALSYNSYPILGEAILLDARYNMITANLKYAKELYERAISLSKEEGLDEIAQQAELELTSLEVEMDKWSSIIDIAAVEELDDKGMEDTSKQLMEFKFLLNPVKLSIVKILLNHNRFPSAQLRSMLGVSWGKFSTHVDSLVKEGVIRSEKEFVDDKPRTLLSLEPKGYSYFEELRNLLKKTIYTI
ncbi:MAG: transcriptional regulator [Candidatus Kariarchaeaceae archaeon]